MWTVESFWSDVGAHSEPVLIRFSNGQNFYFALNKEGGAYQVQRYTPLSTDKIIGQIKHTYKYPTNFNILVNRFNRENYEYTVL